MCLVELPCEVEREGAAGGVVDGEVAIAEDDGICLVGIEDIDAAKVGSQRTETVQVEVFLDTKAGEETRLSDAEIVVLALRGPFHIGTQAEGVRQFDGVSPGTVEPRPRERDCLTGSSRRLVVL